MSNKRSIQFKRRTVLAASAVKDLPSVCSKPCTFEGSSTLFCQTCDLPVLWLRDEDDTQGRHQDTGKHCMNSDSRHLWGWSGEVPAPTQIQQWEADERDLESTPAGHLKEKLLSANSQNCDRTQTLACFWQGEGPKVYLTFVGLLLL